MSTTPTPGVPDLHPDRGVPDQLAVTAHHLLFAIINGFTLDETTELGVENSAPMDEQAATAARDYVAALPRRTVSQSRRAFRPLRRKR
jgi:hypothetical protein